MTRASLDDTIASISTATGSGALAIVRLSGSKSLQILSELFVHESIDLRQAQHHRLYYGKIRDPRKQKVIDEVMVVYMPAGRSFTMEEMGEIQCHGGKLVTREILKLLLDHGARLAEPGEFTRRAYLNGRLDLTQAEAIHNIITARSLVGLESAMSHLQKAFSSVIGGFRDDVLGLVAHLEVLIEYPEEDLDAFPLAESIAKLRNICARIDQILKDSKNARILEEGIRIAIVGKTNVGKSSFFNALLREERAIVSDIHGTTRDFLDATVEYNGIPLQILDTAGIRPTSDIIESQGKEHSLKLLQNTDYILWILDTSRPWDTNDEEVLNSILAAPQRRLILIHNKQDLPTRLEIPPEAHRKIQEILHYQLAISVTQREGFRELEQAFTELFISRDLQINEQKLLCTIRHERLLRRSREQLTQAIESINTKTPPEYLALELKEILTTLSEITGEVSTEEILTEIFTNFCVGK